MDHEGTAKGNRHELHPTLSGLHNRSLRMRWRGTPIKSEDLLYHASREEVQNLVTTVLQMRNEWMEVPSTIKPEMEEREGKGKRKNAKTPTKPSK